MYVLHVFRVRFVVFFEFGSVLPSMSNRRALTLTTRLQDGGHNPSSIHLIHLAWRSLFPCTHTHTHTHRTPHTYTHTHRTPPPQVVALPAEPIWPPRDAPASDPAPSSHPHLQGRGGAGPSDALPSTSGSVPGAGGRAEGASQGTRPTDHSSSSLSVTFFLFSEIVAAVC